MNLGEFLKEDQVFDLSSQRLDHFVEQHTNGIKDQNQQAIALYSAVRDGIDYNPFRINLDFDSYSSSKSLETRQGHCIDKAVLLISCLRVLKIPARLGLARVVNHIGTSRLEKILKTNVLVPHGFVEVYLNQKWVKCTPAFNSSLCEKLGIKPLEFDGETDSIFQQFDSAENKSMEYLEYLGCYSTFPKEKIKSWMQVEYPHMFDENDHWLSSKLL